MIREKFAQILLHCGKIGFRDKKRHPWPPAVIHGHGRIKAQGVRSPIEPGSRIGQMGKMIVHKGLDCFSEKFVSECETRGKLGHTITFCFCGLISLYRNIHPESPCLRQMIDPEWIRLAVHTNDVNLSQISVKIKRDH
jgi:hypothetical protein